MPGQNRRAECRIAPRFLPVKYQMQKIKGQSGVTGRYPCQVKPGLVVLSILLALATIVTGCAKSRTADTLSSPAARDASLGQIAADYARAGDLAQAQAALDKLGLANPTQLLVSLAEADAGAGRPATEIEPLARLAEALGVRSQKLIAYLEPTPTTAPPTATRSPVPPSPTAAPTSTPTTEPPTVTPAPPTVTPTPEPQTPRAVADSDVNLRGGPGKAYPVVGKMRAGQEIEILGRNASGDWWQLAWPGGNQAWVAGTVVQIIGPIDTVAVAKNIPAPPTAAPRPTAAPVAAAPTPQPAKPTTAYVVKSLRLRSIGEDAQTCTGGDHNIFVHVVDPAGNPLDGVRVREIFTGRIEVTGAQGKGPGAVQYDIYRGGGGQVDIVDDAGNRISELSRGMSDDWPDFDLMMSAGYCNCKPHPDPASCQADLVNKTYLFAVGHYAYEVVFQRTY